MQTLKITLFKDGRPGHEKQSLGIVEALSRYVDTEIREIDINRLSGAAQLSTHLRYLFHLDSSPYQVDRTELLIGTGSQTHVPMLTAARTCRAKTVTCMTPASYLKNRFDLCCVPIHDKVRDAANIFRTVGPPNIAFSSGAHDADRGLILIGGVDDASHVWSDEQLLADIELLLEEDRQWTVSTSPRTPGETETVLKDLLSNRENVNYQPFSATPPGWVEEQYQINADVWITGDSVSMVYEALSAGCWIGILPVNWKKSDNKFKRSLDYLAQRNLIHFLDTTSPGSARRSIHEPLNEADRCAKEILRRWWPTSLR